jgi:hypothetical protein
VRIFKNLWFSRFAEKEGISDGELKEAVALLESGRVDADLGGGVYKQRIARAGGGKSGGYRAIVFFKSGERVFFIYGFAKSDKGNITGKQLKSFKVTARNALALTNEQVNNLLKTGKYTEI